MKNLSCYFDQMVFNISLIRRTERYLEFTNEEKMVWRITGRELQKATGKRRVEIKDLCKMRQREWLFQHCFRNQKPFLFSGTIKSKQGKSCHSDYSPCLGDNNALNTCALWRFPIQTPRINKLHRSDFLVLSAHKVNIMPIKWYDIFNFI